MHMQIISLLYVIISYYVLYILFLYDFNKYSIDFVNRCLPNVSQTCALQVMLY